jgi:polyphosphate glucokinase
MMNVLVIDVGGTHVKVLATGQEEARRFPSGPSLTAVQMVKGVLEITSDWTYEAITMGYPGPVLRGRPVAEPRNLAPGWVHFDYAANFHRPVKVINDAAMQALGSYEGGRMLFLGLGTGLGSAMICERLVVPLELAHLHYRKGRTFEDYVGLRGLKRLGPRKWRRAVDDVVARLKAAMVADYVVLGGGNSRRIKTPPPGSRIGENSNAFLGGFRLWEDYTHA